MKFPQHELNIDQYLEEVGNALSKENCYVFIDTNIISQLYRLNKDARDEFYSWIESLEDRFHIPAWVVHEYSRHLTDNAAMQSYFTETSDIKTVLKHLESFYKFVNAYVDNSLLNGTNYQDSKDKLLIDLKESTENLEKISRAISSNLERHRVDVRAEISDKLKKYVLESDIYSLLDSANKQLSDRYENDLPPGFMDKGKSNNAIGDYIIWKEIIGLCEKINNNAGDIIAVYITRDMKRDMVYKPSEQKINDRKARSEEMISIANESLKYEFKLNTDSENLYIINFETFAKIFSKKYSKLAISLQVSDEIEREAEKIKEKIENSNEIDFNNIESPLLDYFDREKPIESLQVTEDIDITISEDIGDSDSLYGIMALKDKHYNYYEGIEEVNACIQRLKSYNWYEQNAAIKVIENLNLRFKENNKENRGSIFVLGRNILQAANGTAGSAISFIENMNDKLDSWDIHFKRALVDGCLYEVFFDSEGKIRTNSFKADFFEQLIGSIGKMGLINPYDFINSALKEKSSIRFVPEVGSKKVYKFKFDVKIDDESFILNSLKTESLKINNEDVSNTFSDLIGSEFSTIGNLKNKLSSYYAILKENIEIEQIPNVITSSELDMIYFIKKKREAQ